MTTRRFNLRAWQLANSAAGGNRTSAVPRPLTRRQVAARLATLRCDPLAIMAELAKNPRLDPTLRVALARYLAAYLIAPMVPASGDKALPALGDVIAAAWRKPKAAAQFTAKSKAVAANRKRKAAKR